MWQVTSIVGIVAATAVPSEWGLQFAGTLALLALAIPLCLEWPGLAGAAVAAPIAVRGARSAAGSRTGRRNRRGHRGCSAGRCNAGAADSKVAVQPQAGSAVVNVYMSLVTAGIILATFTTRSTLLLVPRFKLSPRVEAALRFAPVCALAVLVVPGSRGAGRCGESFLHQSRSWWPHLAATAFFLWTRSMVACIAVGMVALTAFRLL